MLRIIGAGFGRTGTHSLGQALVHLGYGPCYNILKVSQNPGHTGLWTDAMDGRGVDWDEIFAGYRSTVEWPAVAFLPELVHHYPEARVILTQRDPDAWYESARATIFQGLALSAHHPDPVKREQSGMVRRLILERTFASQYREKEFALRVYREHNRRVHELVPEDRLLAFHVREGWPPLCAFLGKPVPECPFPHLNERSEFLASEPGWATRIKEEQAGGDGPPPFRG